MTERASREFVAEGVEPVRRRLLAHGGDLQVTHVSPDGVAQVEFTGACSGCPALAFTFSAVVGPAVERLPGVTGVTSPQVKKSRFVMARVDALMRQQQTSAGKASGSIDGD